MKRSTLPILLLGLVMAGCAVKEDTGSSGSSNVITAEQIQEVPVTDAYDVVRRLRPHWLRHRAAATARNPTRTRPVVYVDGVRAGNVAVLREIRRSNVVRMEFLDPSDATQRYGSGHDGGVIRVTTG